jgi:quinol monooxygenase YgiN
MHKKRRTLFAALAVAPMMAQAQAQAHSPAREQGGMFGLIGKLKIQPGQRDALIEILLAGTQSMPGCLSYVIARDPKDPDAIWITEVWDSVASHKASLGLPAVKEALTRGRPLITGFGERFETHPVGGVGLALSK